MESVLYDLSCAVSFKFVYFVCIVCVNVCVFFVYFMLPFELCTRNIDSLENDCRIARGRESFVVNIDLS